MVIGSWRMGMRCAPTEGRRLPECAVRFRGGRGEGIESVCDTFCWEQKLDFGRLWSRLDSNSRCVARRPPVASKSPLLPTAPRGRGWAVGTTLAPGLFSKRPR